MNEMNFLRMLLASMDIPKKMRLSFLIDDRVEVGTPSETIRFYSVDEFTRFYEINVANAEGLVCPQNMLIWDALESPKAAGHTVLAWFLDKLNENPKYKLPTAFVFRAQTTEVRREAEKMLQLIAKKHEEICGCTDTKITPQDDEDGQSEPPQEPEAESASPPEGQAGTDKADEPRLPRQHWGNRPQIVYPRV